MIKGLLHAGARSRNGVVGNVRNPGCDGPDKEALFTIIGVYSVASLARPR